MTRLAALLRFWLTFDEPVGRREYIVHGLGLAVLKYGVDVALVAAATGEVWTPWSYLVSAPVLLAARFDDASGWLAPTLVAWTIPFQWIGVTMTLRRAIDARFSAWVALLFFVPFVAYLTILILCVAPGAPAPPDAADRRPGGAKVKLPGVLLSMAAGAAVGLGMLVLTVRLMNGYGLALFMGTPFAVGVVTAFVLCRSYPASRKGTLEVVTMTSLLVAGAAFALGTEGVICLVMLMPMGLGLALMGGVVGRWIALFQPDSFRGAGLAVLLLPVTAALEEPPRVEALREVVTAVEIDAPTDVVWQNVIAFRPLAEPDELLFRLGVAYPTHARIEGTGVGATRYCVFSTGAFVEPITAWEPGVRLAFDVVESPPPLRELTPYDIAPPHLDGYLAPRRGEFRLIELPGGRTRLEGSTWYEQRLQPEGYWAPFSDRIISMIHGRVLDHVRALSEASAR